MADDIKQTLGFDASQALDVLKQLDQLFQGFETRLTSVAGKLSNFNGLGSGTVTALNQIRDAANEAAAAVGKLNSANFSGPKGGAGSAGLSGQAAADAFDSLLGGGTAKVQAGQQAVQNLIQSMTNLQSTQGRTAQGFNQVGQAATSSLGAAQSSTASFVVSWETLVRVVTTQAIVRALSGFRDAVESALQGAVEFQRSIARIQTIAPGEKFSDIADGVRKISDSFNLPLLETAEGVYQAVSNQVGNLGESLQFTAEAAVFSKATNASLKDSIDLLSGAIKSFGLTNEDTSRVAGVFFTAIDKGRVTADELANTIGRIGPSAHNVGISLEEMAGGVAAVSIKGVATNEALTQFRGIITALTKPTDAMQQKLHQLGFASVETAVATLRLDGLLQALAQSTNGNSQQLAALFPNVRGLGGALSLTGKNLQDFARDIQAAQAAEASLIKEKAALVFATDAEKATGALNKLKNALVVDFGQAALHTIAQFVELSGGAETFVKAGELIIPVVSTLVGVLATAVISMQAARFAAVALAGPQGIAAITAAVIAATPAVVRFIENLGFEARTAGIKAFAKATTESVAQIAQASAQLGANFDKAVNSQVQAGLKLTQSSTASYLKYLATAKTVNAEVVADTERTLNRIVSVREKFLKDIENAIVASRNNVKESQFRQQDLKIDKSDLNFDFLQQGLSDARQIVNLTQRSKQIADQAATSLNKAVQSGDKEQLDRALAQFDKAQGELAKAQAIAARTAGTQDDRQILAQQNKLIDQRINLENQLQQQEQARQQALLKEKEIQEKIVEQIRQQAAIAIANTGDFDKNGLRFNAEQQAQRDAARQAALRNIAQLGFNQKDLDVSKALGLSTFIQKIQDDLRSKPIELVIKTENAIQQVRNDLTKAAQNLEAKFNLAPLEKVTGKQLFGLDPEEINKAIREIGTEAQSLAGRIRLFNLQGDKRAEILGEIDSLLAEIQTHAQQRVNLAAGGSQTVKEEIKLIDTALQKVVEFRNNVANGGLITPEEIDALKTVLSQGIQGGNTLAEKIGIGNVPQELKSDLKLIGDVLGKIGDLKQNVDNSIEVKPEELDRFQQLKDVLLSFGTPTEQAKAALDGMSTAASEAASGTNAMQINLNTAKFSAAAIAQELAAAAISAREAAAASAAISFGGGGGGTAVEEAFGGAIQAFKAGGMVKALSYFGTGGGAHRGTDTQNALLSPGEFVVKASEARKNFPLLQAINAGFSPGRLPGGDTTTVGDITVNLTGTSHSEADARRIGQALRREIRRRTLVLR
jgi:TP901 family phage tail tape measure protein